MDHPMFYLGRTRTYGNGKMSDQHCAGTAIVGADVYRIGMDETDARATAEFAMTDGAMFGAARVAEVSSGNALHA